MLFVFQFYWLDSRTDSDLPSVLYGLLSILLVRFS